MTKDNIMKNRRTKEKTFDEKKATVWLDIVVSVAKTFLQVCLFVMALFLVYHGVRYSYYRPKDADLFSKAMTFYQDKTWQHITFSIAVFVILTGIYFFLNRKPGLKEIFDSERFGNVVLIISSLFLLVTGFIYIKYHPYYPVGDQINTAQGSVFAIEGNFIMFTKGGYIGLFEQQKGLLFMYEILFFIFGDFNFAAISRMHVLINVLTLIFGNLFIKEVSGKTFCRNLYCLLQISCLPLFIYLPFAYGDLPSIAMFMIMFWSFARFEKSMRIGYAVIAAVSATVAILFRTNAWIVIIAAAIGLLLSAFEKRNLKPVIAMLCLLMFTWGGVQRYCQNV